MQIALLEQAKVEGRKEMKGCCFWNECVWEFRKVTSQKDPGFIVKGLRWMFAVFYLLSFSKWISGTLKARRKIDTGNLRPYSCIEIYVTVWFFIEVAVASTIASYHWPVIYSQSTLSHVFALFFVVLFSYRLFDIFQSWVSQYVLKSRWEAINVNRSLVLAFVGYIEITIIGAIIRFAYQQSSYFSDAFYNSVMTVIANPQREDMGLAIMYTQIGFAILFLTAVAQNVVGRLSSK